MKSFVCDECNQMLLMELLHASCDGYKVCQSCKENKNFMYLSMNQKAVDKRLRNKELKARELSLNIICEAQVKTVNNAVVTQLSMF